MNNKNVKELKKAAKDQGLCRYSRLRKHQLIALLSGNEVPVDSNTILDDPVPFNEVPVLKPVKAKMFEFVYNNHYKNKLRIRESKTAIKHFTKQCVVDGVEGTDAMTFLKWCKSEIVNFLSNTRQIKMNLVLVCEMERVDINSGEVTQDVVPFISKTELVLEGTDVEELYN
ncbi:hypothetical protein DPMN_022657 [Dreissena polymorpha]|uniref:Rho termination factor N-terminal domain-containing protein n=1 Tax=Dreissena polymorpha TaxID=45954 RepID=A0A9D4SAY7_DREPO|nr:hypothetical protein DPMN_022657 [Dreissena polymorpha]